MRVHVVRALLAAAIIGGSVLPAGTTLAQPMPTQTPDPMTEAKARYKRGLGLYNDGNYEAARVEFTRAYSLAPSNVILYNIGICNAKLNDYVAAIATLQKYLKEGGIEIAPERRAEVDALLADLKPRIGKLLVTSNVKDAIVQVDDVSICEERGSCTTPLRDPLPVNPGRRRITVSKPGWIPQTQSIVVAGSETARIDVALTPATVEKKVNFAPYAAWGATALLAAGAGVTGYLAIKNSNDLSTKDNQPGVSDQDLNSTRSAMRTFGVTADILTGAAVVAGGLALYLTLKPSKEHSGSTELGAGVGPGTFVLRGSF